MVLKKLGTFKVRGTNEPVILLKGARIGDRYDACHDEKSGDYLLRKVNQ